MQANNQRLASHNTCFGAYTISAIPSIAAPLLVEELPENRVETRLLMSMSSKFHQLIDRNTRALQVFVRHTNSCLVQYTEIHKFPAVVFRKLKLHPCWCCILARSAAKSWPSKQSRAAYLMSNSKQQVTPQWQSCTCRHSCANEQHQFAISCKGRQANCRLFELLGDARKRCVDSHDAFAIA
jgi:hypothetical protein